MLDMLVLICWDAGDAGDAGNAGNAGDAGDDGMLLGIVGFWM